MTSIRLRLSFLLLLLHVSVFAAPISLRSSSSGLADVEPSSDLALKGITQALHAKRQSSTNPAPALNNNVVLCPSTDVVGKDAPSSSGMSKSLSNALSLCDNTGPNAKGVVTQAIGLTNGRQVQDALPTTQASLVRGGPSVGTTSAGGVLGSPISEISTSGLANITPASTIPHSADVTSGVGSDGSIGNAKAHLPPADGALAIGSGDTTDSEQRALSRLDAHIDRLSGGIVSSTTNGAIPAGVSRGPLGDVIPGSITSQSLDIVSGDGGEGSLGSIKVESLVAGSAFAVGYSRVISGQDTGTSDDSGKTGNSHGDSPTGSKSGQPGSQTHDASPNSKGGSSGESVNGTPKGQGTPSGSGREQPNNNAPNQSNGANGPSSSTGRNGAPSSPSPNGASAPNSSNSPNGSKTTPTDGDGTPGGTTNHDGNIADFGMEAPGVGNAQRLGVNGMVRQGNL